MLSIRVWLAEFDEMEDVFAIDPVVVITGGANATDHASDALAFATEADCAAWCKANPKPPAHPCEMVYEPDYLH